MSAVGADSTTAGNRPIRPLFKSVLLSCFAGQAVFLAPESDSANDLTFARIRLPASYARDDRPFLAGILTTCEISSQVEAAGIEAGLDSSS